MGLLEDLAKYGYKPDMKCFKIKSTFYIYGYTLKTDLATFTLIFFPLFLARETVQNHFIFEFLICNFTVLAKKKKRWTRHHQSSSWALLVVLAS
jgi:hypothetical protein